MDRPRQTRGRGDDRTTQELLRLNADRQVNFDFVLAEAGDRQLSGDDLERHARIRARLGRYVHAELLFALTHQQYPPEEAREHWQRILAHRRALRTQLGRDPGISVATMDFLTNVEEHFDRPTLIAEPKIIAVAEAAIRDGMTGLFDHTAFFVSLRKELQRHARYGDPVSVIMLDVDHFKHYNDTRGHRGGDRVLGDIAHVIAQQTRELDLAARYGGDEFAVLAPSTQGAAAYMLAERLRQALTQALGSEGITVSIGVGTCPRDGRTAEALIQAADRALFQAKRQGRNQTCRCSEPAAPSSA